MLLSRLQGDGDMEIQQAIDELYVHHLLAESYDVRYEKGEHRALFRAAISR
jgi:hypothetical protein